MFHAVNRDFTATSIPCPTMCMISLCHVAWNFERWSTEPRCTT